MAAPFRLRNRLASFRHAGRGLRWLVASQHNAWLHLAATVAVIIAGWVYRVGLDEWGLLILAIGLVWLAEGMNTALEFLADAVKPSHVPLVGKAKDVAAGAVLAAAGAALVVGLLVFGPRLLVAVWSRT